ncbi:MAG: hypothetical protein ACYCSP_01355 [Acidobacteriaceae bacterium]
MKISGDWLRRQIAICLVLFLAVPFAEAATARPQPQIPGPQAESVSSLPAQSENSNRATGKSAVDTAPSASFPAAPDATRAQTIDQQSSASLSFAQEQQQNGTSGPVGAAAAPYEKTTGVAASRPSGAAIAPAKQRRARSILIKVGVLLGAGIAIGTVVALSSASPSRPH